MKVIGLTGGSGTGKGTVAAHLRALGAGWVDADGLYRTLCATEPTMLAEIGQAFAGTVRNGALDRPHLAALVFGNPARLKQLGEITTPYLRAASCAAIEAQRDHAIVLYDAPTLFETGLDSLCASTVGVLAPREVRVARIMARDGIDEIAARSRVNAQPDDAFYQARCDDLVYNTGELDALWTQVDALYARWCKESRESDCHQSNHKKKEREI